ncbi:iron(II)-dependent oxidoreductase [Actinoalloteichus hoggarensis]|uniref:D-inositol 3-phosphate glycosyltransferase n=1 Tax=Actinoalloteichus hoggarensis TaxID=1470176 RepID=A0A221W7R7_9PSEU|nr:glycosyltransferase family 4 protein [Actinoalloteichus hoggarensis]ASO21569.1 D-inositol 3-phosphate glycosyltransferase [Actinoalloteichus hoggarensis]MBB5922161.1 iron(II)-dependent oxidoreductase [Actinoalloteichus hoggarensis]
MADDHRPRTVAFVLASYTPDAPAGIERATAALAQGLRDLGHHAVIVTAAAQPHQRDDVIRLTTPRIAFPCDDMTLRAAIHADSDAIAGELETVFDTHDVDITVYCDALWGLGRIAVGHRAVPVLAAHVLGHDEDLQPALGRARHVIAPSAVVPDQATARGHDTTRWRIVPNALLHDPAPTAPARRAQLRTRGPIRALARLGAEKNVAALLTAGRLITRPVDVIVADAAFETRDGAQDDELARCRFAAAHLRIASFRRGGLAWHDVPAWLAEAAVVIVPSLRESFGLVALEAMAVGTPVVAFAVDNLPHLIGSGPGAGGVVVPPTLGEDALWKAAQDLMADRLRYVETARAAYYRSRDYLPTTVAQTFLKAVGE